VVEFVGGAGRGARGRGRAGPSSALGARHSTTPRSRGSSSHRSTTGGFLRDPRGNAAPCSRHSEGSGCPGRGADQGLGRGVEAADTRIWPLRTTIYLDVFGLSGASWWVGAGRPPLALSEPLPGDLSGLGHPLESPVVKLAPQAVVEDRCLAALEAVGGATGRHHASKTWATVQWSRIFSM
jgi:hypothetical protein